MILLGLAGKSSDDVRANRRVGEPFAHHLRALGEEKLSAFRAVQAGCTLRVLTLHREGEDFAGAWTGALSGNYANVRVAGCWPANQFLDVRVAGERGGQLAGIVL